MREKGPASLARPTLEQDATPLTRELRIASWATIGGLAAIPALALMFGLVVAYLLPSIIAAKRGHMSSGAILALNLLAGWTALGWVVAVVWSLTADTREIAASSRGSSRTSASVLGQDAA